MQEATDSTLVPAPPHPRGERGCTLGVPPTRPLASPLPTPQLRASASPSPPVRYGLLRRPPRRVAQGRGLVGPTVAGLWSPNPARSVRVTRPGRAGPPSPLRTSQPTPDAPSIRSAPVRPLLSPSTSSAQPLHPGAPRGRTHTFDRQPLIRWAGARHTARQPTLWTADPSDGGFAPGGVQMAIGGGVPATRDAGDGNSRVGGSRSPESHRPGSEVVEGEVGGG